MADEKVVWLLGSGFSKPLGGPLLRDLFLQQERDEILPYFPNTDYPDLARSLHWVQRCFNRGKPDDARHSNRARGFWTDAENFLAYVDDAYGGADKRQRLLRMLILMA